MTRSRNLRRKNGTATRICRCCQSDCRADRFDSELNVCYSCARLIKHWKCHGGACPACYGQTWRVRGVACFLCELSRQSEPPPRAEARVGSTAGTMVDAAPWAEET